MGIEYTFDGGFRTNRDLTRDEMCKLHSMSLWHQDRCAPAISSEDSVLIDEGALEIWARQIVLNDCRHPRSLLLWLVKHLPEDVTLTGEITWEDTTGEFGMFTCSGRVIMEHEGVKTYLKPTGIVED